MTALAVKNSKKKNLLQTVAVVVPAAVASPIFPQIEFGFCVFPVNFVAPGIITQS
jgi:hypothetical protein